MSDQGAKDQVSTNPKAVLEAQKLAAKLQQEAQNKSKPQETTAESSSVTEPTPDFSPIAVAKASYEAVVDKRYNVKSFDDIWTPLCTYSKTLKMEALGCMNAEEFRLFCDAVFFKVNSMNLKAASERHSDRSRAAQIESVNRSASRLGIPEAQPLFADPRNGIIRKAKAGGMRTDGSPGGNSSDDNSEIIEALKDLAKEIQ